MGGKVMRSDQLSIEEFVDEDRSYHGSRFSEVRDAVFSRPYQETWDGVGRMPTYKVTLSKFLRGILPFGGPYVFRQATARAVDSTPTWVGDQKARVSDAYYTRTAFVSRGSGKSPKRQDTQVV